MSTPQRDHEDYWAQCWAVALGRHLSAQVQSSRPAQEPPDVDFAVRSSDGAATTAWGEVTRFLRRYCREAYTRLRDFRAGHLQVSTAGTS